MATLQAMGAPILGEAGVGYLMQRGYFLPPLQFDADELDALVLGTRLIAARGDHGLADAARRVTAKIGATLDDNSNQIVNRLPLRAVARQSDERVRAGLHLGFLRRAIRDRALLNICYVDLRDKESQRVARPLGLTAFDEVWLLTIWCDTKEGFRNLRVDRLKTIERTGQRFGQEPGKRFDDYLKSLT